MISVNGVKQKLVKSITIQEWLNDKKLNIELVAIEHNGQLLTKELYQKTTLQSGDKLEVISFVGGG